jgi:hypothetical protein
MIHLHHFVFDTCLWGSGFLQKKEAVSVVVVIVIIIIIIII